MSRTTKRPSDRFKNPTLTEEFRRWYDGLPEFKPDMAVKCPTKNSDGAPAEEVCGCGSTNVRYGLDGMYDCFECGIFFSDYAADPPHRRERDRD